MALKDGELVMEKELRGDGCSIDRTRLSDVYKRRLSSPY